MALLLEIDDKATIPQCPSKAYLIQGFLGDSQLKLGSQSDRVVLVDLAELVCSAYPACLAELTAGGLLLVL